MNTENIRLYEQESNGKRRKPTNALLGQFMYFAQDERPNSHKLDMSLLRLRRENSLTLKLSQFTALSTEDRPCTHEVGYSFHDCVEQVYAEK